MVIETIEIANLMPGDLKKGHKIINVGIISSVEEWANVFVAQIHSPCIKNLETEVLLPKFWSVKIECKNGCPSIY